MIRHHGLFAALLAAVFAFASFGFAPEARAAHTPKHEASAVAATDAAMKSGTADEAKPKHKKTAKHSSKKNKKKAASKAKKKTGKHSKKTAKKAAATTTTAESAAAESPKAGGDNISDTMQNAPAEPVVIDQDNE